DGSGSLPILEEDITQPRLALALCPGIHTVAEGATDRLGARLVLGRDRPDFHLRIGLDLVGKNLEAGTGEMFGYGLDLDGVAQVGLVRAVFADRGIIRNTRPAIGDALAVG